MAVEIRTPTSLVEHNTNILPPLENGDRLTRAEFERRYEAMPDTKKAELIDGVVYMPSPVRVSHGRPHAWIMLWLGTYTIATPRVDLIDNATVRLDIDNEPQPDALLRLDSEHGGRSIVGPDDYVEGPPELVVEIALSSAAYDLHDKMRIYRRNGVQEYLVWQVYDKRVDWWELRDEVYAALPADEHGVVRSRVFPGLWLAIGALLKGDMAQVLATLQQGLQSDEHAVFQKKVAGES
ncbi:MAG TPA: Uma2 family endonuclease [Roseiflexaceae bacterium]|jgi:Uma2 family endonuclease|nr:Uma2 family endonuclease [Roseiflexaceae bacterium]